MKSNLKEIYGILIVTFGFLLFLSLLSYNPADNKWLTNNPLSYNWIGLFGANAGAIMLMGFGIASYMIPFGIIFIGCKTIFRASDNIYPRFLWFILAVCSLAVLVNPSNFWYSFTDHFKTVTPGGLIGDMLQDRLFGLWIGYTGTAIIFFVTFIISLARMLDIQIIDSIKKLWHWYNDRISKKEKSKINLLKFLQDNLLSFLKEGKYKEKNSVAIEEILKEQEEVLILEQDHKDFSDKKITKKEQKDTKQKKKITSEKESKEEVEFKPINSSNCVYQLPSIELLDPHVEQAKGMSSSQISDMGKVLTNALEEFGVEAKVTGVQQGPVVTCYEILPAAGVRVERIKALADNIALKLHAKSIRIQAPIPGKGVCGVEVPNMARSGVFFRDMVESKDFKPNACDLPLILGKDVSGESMILDLAKMPHMLIAGATGAGKSVCMNTILTGLLMKYSPEDLRILLVDPKTVEFQTYNNLPHLVVPVITDAKKVSKGLNWVIGEMERRFKYFNQTGVRDIQGYNNRTIATQDDLFNETELQEVTSNDTPPNHLPYIVVIIDELADLMAVAQAEIEARVARLAAKSRAAGIHMILATQRPDVKVITGTIKANFPARVAFKVSQKVDSRTILDRMGADALLGKGDMLVLPPGSDKLIRLQGAFTSDGEIERVTSFWKNQGKPEFITEIKDDLEKPISDFSEVDDSGDQEMVDQAMEVIRQTKRASTSSLQRRLRIGYTRAARIMDLLEERGIIGPPDGAGPREILIDIDEVTPSETGDENETDKS